jgi:hypothetical protein
MDNESTNPTDQTQDTLPADSAADRTYEAIAEEMVDDALTRAETTEAEGQIDTAILVDPEADIYEATAGKLVDGMLEPRGLAPDPPPAGGTHE